VTVRIANGSSAAYWNTPRRGWINLSTGEFEQYPDMGPGGGPPYRGESDAEFAARVALHDAGVQRIDAKCGENKESPTPPLAPTLRAC